MNAQKFPSPHLLLTGLAGVPDGLGGVEDLARAPPEVGLRLLHGDQSQSRFPQLCIVGFVAWDRKLALSGEDKSRPERGDKDGLKRSGEVTLRGWVSEMIEFIKWVLQTSKHMEKLSK